MVPVDWAPGDGLSSFPILNHDTVPNSSSRASNTGLGPGSRINMSRNNLVGVTPTSNAPNSISDLEALLAGDIKVKVAGEFHTDITPNFF